MPTQEQLAGASSHDGGDNDCDADDGDDSNDADSQDNDSVADDADEEDAHQSNSCCPTQEQLAKDCKCSSANPQQLYGMAWKRKIGVE